MHQEKATGNKENHKLHFFVLFIDYNVCEMNYMIVPIVKVINRVGWSAVFHTGLFNPCYNRRFLPPLDVFVRPS